MVTKKTRKNHFYSIMLTANFWKSDLESYFYKSQIWTCKSMSNFQKKYF